MPTSLSREPIAASPLATRLEHAVTQLRRQLEEHFDQQSRLQVAARDLNGRWCDHCGTLTRQLVLLEAHLSTWMSRWQPPRLTVISPAEETAA